MDANEVIDRHEWAKLQVEKYKQALEALVANKQIESYRIDSVSTLWDTWSNWKKLTWNVLNVLGIRQWRYKKYLERREKVIASIYKSHTPGIERLDQNLPNETIWTKTWDSVLADAAKTRMTDVEILNKFEDENYKYWYCPEPVVQIVFDVKFKPVLDIVNMPEIKPNTMESL